MSEHVINNQAFPRVIRFSASLAPKALFAPAGPAGCDRCETSAEGTVSRDEPQALVLKAVELAGSQSSLSRAVGFTRSAVYYWVRHGTRPGPKAVLALHAFINGYGKPVVPKNEVRREI